VLGTAIDIIWSIKRYTGASFAFVIMYNSSYKSNSLFSKFKVCKRLLPCWQVCMQHVYNKNKSERTKVYFHVNTIIDFPITYRNVSVICQSECACLRKTVNLVVFFVKSNENTKRESTHANVHSCP